MQEAVLNPVDDPNDPAEQAVQAVIEPVVGENVPAAHERHAVCDPALEYVPELQGVHCVEPEEDWLLVPALQAMQLDAPTPE